MLPPLEVDTDIPVDRAGNMTLVRHLVLMLVDNTVSVKYFVLVVVEKVDNTAAGKAADYIVENSSSTMVNFLNAQP